MKCRLIKIEGISGKSASFYSIVIGDSEKTLLDNFIIEYSVLFKDEIIDILKRL